MNDSYSQHPSDKHTAAPHNAKHTSLSLGAQGQRLAAQARMGGGSGAGRRVGKRGGRANSDITIDSLAAAHTKGIKGIARQESPPSGIARPCPQY
jgi:hypothetical protein